MLSFLLRSSFLDLFKTGTYLYFVINGAYFDIQVPAGQEKVHGLFLMNMHLANPFVVIFGLLFMRSKLSAAVNGVGSYDQSDFSDITSVKTSDKDKSQPSVNNVSRISR